MGYLPMSRSNGSRTRQSPRALKITFRAKLAPGENVLILGATGVTGKLAVRIAKLLGAARVVAAGRNQQILNSLRQLGADATIRLDTSAKDLHEAFVREAGEFVLRPL
ncbi:MAG TPA: hypothetical protein VEV41_24455 [Terriglobales bacterium]|nr:hypothetical protein [Terriglobales bacterium]